MAVRIDELQHEIAVLKARVAELEERELPVEQQVIALKKRVRDVAKKYTDQHGWCREVTRALEEAGLGRTFKRVQVDTYLPLVMEVDAEEFDNMTDDEKAAYLAEHIKLARSNGNGSTGIRNVALSGESVAIGSVVDAPVTAQVAGGRFAVPDGFVLRCTGEGRVMHLVDEDRMRGNGWVDALCGRFEELAMNWRETSPRMQVDDRGQFSICVRCRETAERRTRV